MNPWVATFIYACGIAGLFFLDRDKTLRTSKALWIPVLWLLIIGSRGPTVWLGLSPPAGSDVQMDGTPLDRIIFLALQAAGVIVLVQRGRKAIAALRANWPIVLFFAFGLMSVFWSDFPDVSAKRWIKAIGDVVMVLIIVTDPNPAGAFKRIISRVGFILLPASVLLIKYFPDLGRRYDPWVGTTMYVGVTTSKNLLGVIVFVLSVGALWCVLTLLQDKGYPGRSRHLVAQGTLLGIGLVLLVMSNSATSRASFAMAAFLMVATRIPFIRRRPGAVHTLVFVIMIIGGSAMLLGGGSGVAHALGRNGDLTGRTEIWQEIIPMAPNAILGAGFESFWLGPRLAQIWAANAGNPLNEAHNGYIEIYLNLGWAGLILMALILVTGYRRAALAFRRDPTIGGMLLAYVGAATIYSLTEAGFRMLNPMWVFLLFAIFAASSLVSGVITADTKAEASELLSVRPRVALPTARNALNVGSFRGNP